MLQKKQPIYGFGPFTLDVPGHLLSYAGREIGLEPKAFKLLEFFVLHARQLVSRDEIKSAIWGEVAITPNNVDRKITDLRSVFRRYDPSRQYIRNIRNFGWRFEVTVTEVSEVAAAESVDGLVEDQPVETLTAEQALEDGSACLTCDIESGCPNPIANPALRGARRTWLLFGIAAAGLAAIAAVAGLTARANLEPHGVVYRQLTWDGRPKEGPLASDGRYVYFSEAKSGAQDGPALLAAVSVGGGEVLFPPNPVDPPAMILDVARTTRDILYGRGFLETSAVFIHRHKQDLLERAAATSGYVRISPDGRSIAFPTESERNGSIVIRDLTDRPNVRTIALSGIPRGVAWSIDGSRIRFPVLDPLSETSVYWEIRRDGSNLHRLPMASKPRFNLLDGSWTADGRWFVYSESSAGGESPSSLWIRDEDAGEAQRLPVRLTNSPMSFDSPAMAWRGHTVFARGSVWKNQLDRYDASRGEFTTFWRDVGAVDVSFSNDGAWAAYRSAADETLWISKTDGSARRQLTQPPLRAYQPHWSPDGRRIAFMGLAPNHRARIFIIGASGGQPQPAKPDDSQEQGVPSWSADGRYLVFGELRNRRSDDDMLIQLLDLQTGKETVLPESKGRWTARWSPDGRYIVAVASRSGSLALFDCARRRWMPLVTDNRNSIEDPVWSLDSRFVHFTALTDSGRALHRVRIADAAVERLASCPPTMIRWSGVAPDGSPLVLNSTRIDQIYAIDFK